MDRLKHPQKVKYIGGLKTEVEVLVIDKIYDVMSIEKGWYRIYCELHDDYLFPPEMFEIVE